MSAQRIELTPDQQAYVQWFREREKNPDFAQGYETARLDEALRRHKQGSGRSYWTVIGEPPDWMSQQAACHGLRLEATRTSTGDPSVLWEIVPA